MVSFFTANGEAVYRINDVIYPGSKYVELINISTDEILYFPLKNFTIADYDILKSIPFKLPTDGQFNPDELQIQALYYGAGWVVNVNKATPKKIHAFLEAVKERRGIWSIGYMEKFANKKTYTILKKYLRKNNIVIGSQDSGMSNKPSQAILHRFKFKKRPTGKNFLQKNIINVTRALNQLIDNLNAAVKRKETEDQDKKNPYLTLT